MAFNFQAKGGDKAKGDSSGGKMDPKKLAGLKKFATKTKNKKLLAKVAKAEAAAKGK